MSEAQIPRRWSPRDKVSAAHLNEMVDVCARVSALSSSGRGRQAKGPTGTHHHIEDVYRYRTIRVGYIASAGPSAEADWTDERYWVKSAFLVNLPDLTVTWPPAATFTADGTFSQFEPWPLTVTNIAEAVNHTHLLTPTDSTKPVVFWAEMDDAGTLQWIMDVSPASKLMPVTLVKDGGSDGTVSTACTYTYTVKDSYTGVTIATGITYGGNRPFGETTPATRGTLRLSQGTNSGTIWDLDEVPVKIGPCT
jgi:hypothetical protein